MCTHFWYDKSSRFKDHAPAYMTKRGRITYTHPSKIYILKKHIYHKYLVQYIVLCVFNIVIVWVLITYNTHIIPGKVLLRLLTYTLLVYVIYPITRSTRTSTNGTYHNTHGILQASYPRGMHHVVHPCGEIVVVKSTHYSLGKVH